jgi:hypothetical protein
LINSYTLIYWLHNKWENILYHLYYSDCGSPDKLDNGSYKVSSTTFGSSAVVKCDAGYEGNKKDIDCLASGKWEKAKCNIKGNKTDK